MTKKFHQLNIRFDDRTYKELQAMTFMTGLSKAEIDRLSVKNYYNGGKVGRATERAISKRQSHDNKNNELFDKCSEAVSALNENNNQLRRFGNNLNQIVRDINNQVKKTGQLGMALISNNYFDAKQCVRDCEYNKSAIEKKFLNEISKLKKGSD